MSLQELKSSYRKRDWASCLSVADEALSEARRLDASRRSMETARALLYYGEALKQKGDTELARASFELSVETDPTQQGGYLHWAVLESQTGNRQMARRIVSAGMARVAGSDELRMFEKAEIERPTLSACMIVKNEEEFLANCLESIRDICDEIIVVDTGSEDRTVEIAESFGCKVFHQEWEGDFSKHRNYSLEQATGDWILIIDADEELNEAEHREIRHALNQDNYPIISVTVYNLATRTGQGTTCLPSVRLFRRELALRYDGIVHNRLLFDAETPQLRLPVGVTHHGYDLTPEKMHKKHERSRNLLAKQIASEPDNFFAHFNMAQLVRARSNLATEQAADETLKHATRVIELTDKSNPEELPFHVMAHHQAATALYAKGDLEGAEKHCWLALQMKPQYLDAILALGYVFLKDDRIDDAEKMFKKYLDEQTRFKEHSSADGMITIHLKSRHNALYNLGLIAERRSEWSLAAEYFSLANGENPGFIDCRAREGWALLKLGSSDAASALFAEQRLESADSPILFLGLAEIAIQRGEISQAVSELRSGIEHVADPGMLYARLVDVLAENDSEDEAQRVARTGLESFPDCALLHAAYASLCLRTNAVSEALAEYQEAERLTPGDPSIALGMANAFFIADEIVQAARWYAVTLERDPNLAWAKRNLAIALTRLAKYDDAEPHLRAYVALAPEDRQARAVYGALLLETGENQAALDIFEELLRERPNDNEALLALSDCYLRLQSYESARAGYERLLAINPDDSIARSRLDVIKSKTK